MGRNVALSRPKVAASRRNNIHTRSSSSASAAAAAAAALHVQDVHAAVLFDRLQGGPHGTSTSVIDHQRAAASKGYELRTGGVRCCVRKLGDGVLIATDVNPFAVDCDGREAVCALWKLLPLFLGTEGKPREG